ncbi:MAG: acyl carrier protein [Rhodobacteraceae bacterium]|nr:acyl carrier protein [Paracoccaceae bacterium]
MTVLATVRGVLAARSGIDAQDIGPDTRIADLPMDSMAMVEVLFTLEETYGIVIPYNANRPGEAPVDLTTVGGVVEAVEALLAARV